jgi:hypothetical protein
MAMGQLGEKHPEITADLQAFVAQQTGPARCADPA